MKRQYPRAVPVPVSDNWRRRYGQVPEGEDIPKFDLKTALAGLTILAIVALSMIVDRLGGYAH